MIQLHHFACQAKYQILEIIILLLLFHHLKMSDSVFNSNQKLKLVLSIYNFKISRFLIFLQIFSLMNTQESCPMSLLASTSRALNQQMTALNILHNTQQAKRQQAQLNRLQILGKPRNRKMSKFKQKKNFKTKASQLEQKKQQIQGSKAVASNIRVLRKVATFVEKLKTIIVLSKSALTEIQSFYLQNQDGRQQQQPNSLIAWDNSLLLTFQIILTIFLVFQTWVVTYQMVMERISWALSLHISLIVFFLISIILRLSTQLKTEKLQYLQQKRKIIAYYFKKDFVADAVAIFSLLFISIQGIAQAQSVQLRIISRVFWLFSLKITFRLLNKIQDIYAVQSSVQRTMTLGFFFFKIIVFLHFISLLFNTIAKIQSIFQIQNNWIQSNGLEGSTQFELYLNGYYWASTIVSTVGFGDISPGNVYQRFLMSFIMISCCLFFGYCFNIIGSLISIIGESNVQYQKDIRKLNNYLKNNDTDDSLQIKLKQHFYTRHQIQQRYDIETQQYLFSKMTDQLKTALSRCSNEQVISKSLQLKIFSEKTQKRLAKAMTKMVYGPEQIIFNQGDSNVKLYLIREGLVNEYCYLTEGSSQKKPVAKYCAEDNTLGWINMLTGSSYQTIAKSQGFSLIHEIEKKDFERILQQQPKDYFRFNQFKHKNILKKHKLKKQCIVCSQFNHNVVQCPKIHFISRPVYLILNEIKKQQKSNLNNRKTSYRRKKQRSYLVWQNYDDWVYQRAATNQQQTNNPAPYKIEKKQTIGQIVRKQSIVSSRKSINSFKNLFSFQPMKTIQLSRNMFNRQDSITDPNSQMLKNVFLSPFINQYAQFQRGQSQTNNSLLKNQASLEAQKVQNKQLTPLQIYNIKIGEKPNQIPQKTQIKNFDKMIDKQNKQFFNSFNVSQVLAKYAKLNEHKVHKQQRGNKSVRFEFRGTLNSFIKGINFLPFLQDQIN